MLRELGTSGIKIHPLGMGTWAFGGGSYWGEQSQAEVNNICAAALERGVNFFDTAEVYNAGTSETSLGVALRGKRTQAVVASKIAPSNCGDIEGHLDASLRRLQTDYVDLYMLHWPVNPLALKHFGGEGDARLPQVSEIFDTLQRMVQKGKVRAIGVSNFGKTQLEEALATGCPVCINEIAYNIVSRAIEAEIAPLCLAKNISVVGSMALQQGLLAGAFAAPDDVPPPQAHSRHYQQSRGVGGGDPAQDSRHNEAGAEAEIFALLPELQRIAAEQGITTAQLSVAWVLQKPFIASTLAGCRTVAQLEENIAATEIALPQAVAAQIDALSLPVWQKLGDSADYYENRRDSRIF
ncbi:MAG: aldo/keto reductase [Oscillospiraceae bacterium]|jgi:aryl-alcohol dehydrogenase-like predicted oxidoreductase|nr:aldo/keto reductase [Oscillospiraceae bacterium]